MKLFLTLLILVVLSNKGYTQNIAGTWEGKFTSANNCFPSPIKIYLHLSQTEDSVISGFSTTCFSKSALADNANSFIPVMFDTVRCIIIGIINKDRIELKEISNYNTTFNTKTSNTTDFQEMIMKYIFRKHTTMMKGRWKSDDSVCGKEDIEFKKID